MSIFNVCYLLFQYLLKNDRRSFDDKQLQLYMFGSIVTGLIGVCQVYLVGGEEENSFSYYGKIHNTFYLPTYLKLHSSPPSMKKNIFYCGHHLVLIVSYKTGTRQNIIVVLKQNWQKSLLSVFFLFAFWEKLYILYWAILAPNNDACIDHKHYRIYIYITEYYRHYNYNCIKI